MPIIEVNHVRKEFRLGQLRSLKHTALDALARLRGHPAPEHTRFKALDDVDFKVEQGEVLGIIGQNGAGKSTLLKLLAGITKPTSGRVSVRGKVAPLIEVGAGMVPELSGRENIFLNASILGLKRAEIAAKFDEIVAFAELEEFIDTPIKRYSSGMQMRLGFSIATSIEAEILIVDEVLAVGDLTFQRKCFDRMEQLIKGRGNTVLVVSHNIRQVERMCPRVLLLDHGSIRLDGNAKMVCNAYYELTDERIQEQRAGGPGGGRFESSGDIEIESVRLADLHGRQVDTIVYRQGVEFQVDYRVKTRIANPIFGVGIHTSDFLYLATSQSVGSLEIAELTPGSYTLRYKVQQFPFLPGLYSLRLGVALGLSFQPIFYSENVIHFRVVSREVDRALVSAKKEGFVALDGDWCLTGSNLSDDCARTDNAAPLAPVAVDATRGSGEDSDVETVGRPSPRKAPIVGPTS